MTMRTGSARIRGACCLGGLVFCLANLALCSLANASDPVPSAIPYQESTSLLLAISKVLGALLVVVGIMLVLLYAIKRSGLGAGRSRGGSAIAVLETRMVAPRTYIAIVVVADKCLAIGITDHNITLLTDLGAEVKASLVSQGPAVPLTSAFASLLQKSMKSWRADAGAMASNQDRQESP